MTAYRTRKSGEDAAPSIDSVTRGPPPRGVDTATVMGEAREDAYTRQRV